MIAYPYIYPYCLLIMDITDFELTLRYDGLDAEKHVIALDALGESLQGFSKIISTAAHFAVTQQYSKRSNVQTVRVCAKEARANCFSLHAVLDFVKQNQILSGSLGALLSLLIPYIFAKNSQKNEEMKLLKDALDKAIVQLGNRDRETIDGLIGVIDKMAGDLRPSVRQAVSPIGYTCKRVSVGGLGEEYVSVDEADKEVIDRLDENEITGIQSFSVQISELDRLKGTAKVNFAHQDENERVPAVINDPLLEEQDNPYIAAFSNRETVTIQAKATIKDGRIVKLNVFDIV